MSKRLDVLRAVADMISFAVAGATVTGVDDEDLPARADEVGRIVVGAGDPGEPEVDLGIFTYWYDHAIPIEVTVTRARGRSAEDQADEILALIGAAIDEDRTLGGLCIWLEATAPVTSDIVVLDGDRNVPGARPPRGADFSIIATYGTSSPLS
ncbi:hypothetical protein [Sphingomonas dokdonensis]|uniref:Acyl-CoA transferase n=1 Tax=Sphingomonas dokdonensis TaxID=344880 RepID=A0A245ZHK6_9SPHN|nr:hypothetical protein [Sphingomonas dokdonensis]OWK29208.1 hypothetical protein SPDO_21890 [Sphingomonas dokdonensis]